MHKATIQSLFSSIPLNGSATRIDYYRQSINALEVQGFSPFYGLLLAIWQLRPLDLQHLFPLDTVNGRLGFLAWCAFHGRKEYKALRELDVFWQHLGLAADLSPTAYSPAITRLMVLARMGGSTAGLQNEEQQLALLQWYCSYGWQELGIEYDDLQGCQKAFFNRPHFEDFSFVEVFIYAIRADLQKQFNLASKEDCVKYRLWLNSHGEQQTILKLLKSQTGIRQAEAPIQTAFGVNLIGYAYGELGIGEDVRMAARAMAAADVPFTVINFPPGNDIRQDDKSIAHWVGDRPLYPINIVCLTALEHLRLYAETGAALFRHRYTIGYWPWELQNWPVNWQHCFNLVDEVWVSSSHTLAAIEAVSPVPAYKMPMAVELPEIKRYTRKHWALPDSDYLFVFAFDGNSGLARKNPQGVIDAFQKAFPNGDETVGLVIKCMRPDAENAVWQAILKLAERDSRIYIVDQTLSKSEVLGLYRLCDGFVSLHRAEGFGRGIAEAILLGLDVIATDHGGNVDFCLADCAYLVGSQLTPLADGDYVESAGQYWAEPDIRRAAKLMSEVAGKGRNPRKRVPRAVRNRFSAAVIGDRYRARLQQVFSQLQPDTTVSGNVGLHLAEH